MSEAVRNEEIVYLSCFTVFCCGDCVFSLKRTFAQRLLDHSGHQPSDTLPSKPILSILFSLLKGVKSIYHGLLLSSDSI